MSAVQPVVLLEPTAGLTSFRITASISPANGDIIVHGQDQATGSVTHFSASEYEWFLTIPAEEKDHLLLELMQATFAGDAAIRSTLMQWLEVHSVRKESMAF